MKWGGFAVVTFCLVIAGCGGGSASSPGGSVGEVHSSAVGIATISYFGAVVPAASFSTSGVTITSMAGANFSNVSLTPTPKKENAVLVYANNGQILAYQTGGTPTQITNGVQAFFDPWVTKSGQVFFVGSSWPNGGEQIYGCNLDGSNLHQITKSALNHESVSASPSGTKLVFDNGGNLYTVNSDGTAETKLSITEPNLAAGTLREPVWSPDGTKLAFQGLDQVTEQDEIYTAPTAGGTATEVTNFDAYGCVDPHWSPNGTAITFVSSVATGNKVFISDIRAASSAVAINSAPSDSTYHQPAFTPDGNSVTYQAISSTQSAVRTQLTSDPGTLYSTVKAYSESTSASSLCWSPYFAPKTFIGTGGEMSTASGFIWAQLGDGFGGFASVSAITPASLTLTQQPSGASDGPVVYLAKADRITKIVYSNSYFGAYNSVTPSNSTQALISVSSTTGQIDTIAPLAQPGLTRSTRGELAFDGKFAAIYDSHGRNLAASGARHIQLDSKTGSVISWQ